MDQAIHSRLDALASELDYGKIIITIHAGRVSLIEKNESFREPFAAERRPVIFGGKMGE